MEAPPAHNRDEAESADDHLRAFYGEGTFERDRLSIGRGRLELARTQELLRRYLPAAPARVLDVGGGTGVYAAWLAQEGFEVLLIDPVRQLVAQARARADAQPEHPFRAHVGDARSLDEDEESADVVLLLGPLYHLPDRDDRLRALVEARRVLRPGGLLAGAAIGRYTSLLDLARMGRLNRPTLERLSEGMLRSGRNDPAFGFTTAFFHRPDELAGEITEAGFQCVEILAIEGPAWMLFETAGGREGDAGTPLVDESVLEGARLCARAVEGVPELLGASAHLLAIAGR